VRSTRLVLALAVLLSGCSATQEFVEGKVDYKSGGTTIQPLDIPPDLTTPSRDNRYVVPESNPSTATFSGYQAGQAGRRDPKQPGAAVLPNFDRVRMERAGTQRWLVIQEPAEKLWPLVKEFWVENGFLLQVELPEAGVMETDWAENRAKIPQGGIRDLLGRVFDQLHTSAERDKFRTRLDRTQDGKGTELFLTHRGMQEIYTSARDAQTSAPGNTAWVPRNPDPELEAEYLRRLLVRLGAQEQQAKQMAAATGAKDAPLARASLTKGASGVDGLYVLEPFDRAWRRVGLALDRVGFTVEDRDRQKGLYFVRYADPEAEASAGFFTRMFSSSDKVKAEQYRVQVMQAGTDCKVNVLNKGGGSDTSKTAQRILSLLHEQLK